uniref:Uncharacterized protein n=1 Tax=Arundo donax TaxID=35708 RepID=A0A0A8XZF2_ARUDO
MAPRSWATQ